MDFFKAYCRQKRRLAIPLLVCIFIFLITFRLYHLPVEAVLYPTALSILWLFLMTAADFEKSRKTHEKLENWKKLPAEMLPDFPSVENWQVQDYQQLLQNVLEELFTERNRQESQTQDMVEYYTMWVHQIKTPIASMALSLQEEDSALGRKLSGELFRIEQYVEMVLAYLRLDAPSSDYVFRRQDLDGLIRPCLRRFSTEFITRKIRLDYQLVEMAVVTDEKWFSFCLEQILSNALKYTREGSIRIYRESPGVICVEDTGIGIAPEDLPRVFEKGYTGGNGRLDQKASGIGLYLCRQICDRLGIGISISSRLGEGTCVRMDLNQYQLRDE